MHLMIIGGSDAGISAGLRARELDPTIEVTLVVADEYPNYSICGLPYRVSGEVTDWHHLAHRTRADLEASGLDLRLNTLATAIAPQSHFITARAHDGTVERLSYDKLVVATGARPATAGIEALTGSDPLGPSDGVHVMHTMADLFAIEHHLDTRHPQAAIIVGAGYVGLEMAEALTRRGLQVSMLQRGPEVLSTLDEDLGRLVHDQLNHHGVTVYTGTTVTGIERTAKGPTVTGLRSGATFVQSADLVLVVAGVQPNTKLLADAGATLGPGGAIHVDDHMRTGLPDIFAAGDGVTTLHRLLGTTWLPLGTTAHKQGRIAGTNAANCDAAFVGVLGTQVVKVFDLVAARTGLRDRDADKFGRPLCSTTAVVDDHKAYYPTAHPISIRLTGDTESGRLVGAQFVGSYGTEISKRTDVLATAIHTGLTIAEVSDLDLAYTPPIAAPWDAVQQAAQHWVPNKT